MDRCEGKDFTLTPTLTLFVTDCQPVKRKSEGVRAKNKKNFFLEADKRRVDKDFTSIS